MMKLNYPLHAIPIADCYKIAELKSAELFSI